MKAQGFGKLVINVESDPRAIDVIDLSGELREGNAPLINTLILMERRITALEQQVAAQRDAFERRLAALEQQLANK